MRRRLLVLLMVVALSAATVSAQQGMQDVVYLKNGSVVRGTIVEQIPSQSVRIRTRDGSEFVYAVDDVARITREAALSGTPQNTSLKSKSVGKAFALSLLFPGLGQYYNGGKGNIIKGVIQSGVWGAGLGFFLYGRQTSYSSGCFSFDSFGNCTSYYASSYQPNEDWYKVGTVMMLGSSAWSMIDAPLSASSINRRVQSSQPAAHMIELKHGESVIGFDVAPKRSGVGAQISYSFR